AELHESVTEADVVHLRRAPEQQILHEASQADEERRGRIRALEQIVHRRNAAVGVAGWSVETEQAARQIAVDGEAGACDGAGTERIPIDRAERGLQAGGYPSR